MTLARSGQSGAGALPGLLPVDELTHLLAKADTPFRAWAADALLTAATSRHRAEGRQLANELADTLPGIADLQHAELAGYALIDGMGFLPPMQQERVRAAVPPLHPERGRRARLYDSSVYVYLLARGIGATLPWAADLVRYVDNELTRATGRAPDIVELTLLFAGRLELAGVSPVPEATLRSVRGRLSGAPDDPDAALALRWLLERYDGCWPAGREGTTLKQVARSYAEQSAAQARVPAEERPALAAMQLELGTRLAPQYRLTTEAEDLVRVSKQLGRHRWAAAAAYALLIAVVAGGPMWYSAHAGLISSAIAWAGAVGWGLPALVWLTLSLLGRPREVRALGTATTLGLLYWVLALLGGWAGRAEWLGFLGGSTAFIELALALIAAMWATANAARRAP